MTQYLISHTELQNSSIYCDTVFNITHFSHPLWTLIYCVWTMIYMAYYHCYILRLNTYILHLNTVIYCIWKLLYILSEHCYIFCLNTLIYCVWTLWYNVCEHCYILHLKKLRKQTIFKINTYFTLRTTYVEFETSTAIMPQGNFK